MPRLVLDLASGQLVLLNICLFDADADLTEEDLLIERGISQRLGIDGKAVWNITALHRVVETASMLVFSQQTQSQSGEFC